jgi:hypothetical protein
MNYRDGEKEKAERILRDVIRGEGGGIYGKKRYDFALKNTVLNLWDGIREDALEYFKKYNITWWDGGEDKTPTSLLHSSQVACLNHLYWLRVRKDAALKVIQSLRPDIVDVEQVDEGYVEFEVTGADTHNYLGERSNNRGANATAFDAIMVGKRSSGKNILIAIEWKYTEKYGKEDLYKEVREKAYGPLLERDDCPIMIREKQNLYFEPFYQLMRQTLLAWKMVEAGEHGCDEYIHIHVIPEGNKELLKTTQKLPGDSLTEAWQGVLKEPERYRKLDPQELLNPVVGLPDTKSIVLYLEARYW